VAVAPEYVVTFDLAPTARGAYYVSGEYVWHEGKVCQVQGTERIAGTRFRARLRVVRPPTADQRRQANEWKWNQRS
jgi:hypothetical protein